MLRNRVYFQKYIQHAVYFLNLLSKVSLEYPKQKIKHSKLQHPNYATH